MTQTYVLPPGHTPKIEVLGLGHVVLLDVMPRLVPIGRTADFAVAQAARTSYATTTEKTVEEDRTLIRYLLRHRHTTPFEMVEFKFQCKMPIFVARQWIRHRMASVNEVSARYTEVKDEFWTPEEWRGQSKSNKQGGEEPIDYTPGEYGDTAMLQEGQAVLGGQGSVEDMCFREYRLKLSAGVSREMARSCLPVSTFTEWVWKIDLHNLLRFISLRMDPHAQKEIRDYANAIHDLIATIVPVTLEAWRDYEFEAVRLSRLELAALRTEIKDLRGQLDAAVKALYQRTKPSIVEYDAWVRNGVCPHIPARPIPILEGNNQREDNEWQAKRTRLGLTDC